MAEARAAWRVWQLGIDPSRLVFVDETWATTAMTRLRGRAPSGRRLVAAVPQGHWQTTTLLAALDRSGVRCSMLLDGAVNRDAFEAFVAQVLVPTLRPGDVVVMDNLSSHKGPRVRELVEAAEATLLYLPPYSPDLSPIEPAFSKVKQALRGLEARTSALLWSSMRGVLDLITAGDAAGDAAGYFRHCGYNATDQVQPL